MSMLSEEVTSRLITVSSQIRSLEKALLTAPEGSLRVSTDRKRARYYHITDESGRTGRYIRRAESKLAERLAQKDYDKRVLSLLKKEEKLLKQLEDHYHAVSGIPGSDHKNMPVQDKESFFSGPEELIWKHSVKARRSMVMPIVPDTEIFAEEWMSAEYEKKEFRESDVEYFTGSGIRVRSKTELIIAEMLEKRDIPFYYERPLFLTGYGRIYPDFTVLNNKRRKTLYWEHMGMMDDEGYREYALERINHYIMNGYYPGIDLILTHETSARPIRTQVLEKVIEKYLEQ